MKYIICHYSEIGLKGKNRSFFEKKLVENIKTTLPSGSYSSVKRFPGFISIDTDIPEEIKDKVGRVPGIAYIAVCQKVAPDIDKIKEKVADIFQKKEITSFRITTKRSDKGFLMTSQEVSRLIGGFIVERFGLDVDLENYDFECKIEINREGAFIYEERLEGYGGLPVGVSGKGILLLSGGIDSPVAGFKMMKRGLQLDFAHFHAYPLVSDDSIKKAKKLFDILKRYSPESRLFLIPFGELQKKIRLEVPESLRIIFYRRLMLKIAENIAREGKAESLVTGESLGQVSSQTLTNMRVAQQIVDLPVLRPLVGENKEEIINVAKEIETYDISILPDQDCCTLFNPRNPDTGASLEQVVEIESKIELGGLIEDSLKNKRTLT